MSDFPQGPIVAENVLIFDDSGARRTTRALQLVRRLLAEEWTVFVYATLTVDEYREDVNGYFVRKYLPIGEGDVREITEAKKVHGRVAVVLDGLLDPGESPLLRDPDIFVLAASSVRAICANRRYSRIWSKTSGAWATRGTSKGFVEVVTGGAAASKGGVLGWLRSWVMGTSSDSAGVAATAPHTLS